MCEKLFTTDSKVGKSERAIPMGVWGEINDCVWETVSTWDKQKPNQARWNARITFISLSFSFVVYSFLYLKPHIWMLSTHPTKSHWQHQNYEVYLSVYYFCALVIISRLILCVLLWCVNLFFFLSFATSIVTVFVLYADIVDHNFYYSSCRFHTYKTKPLVIWQQRRRWASESKRKKKCEKNKL